MTTRDARWLATRLTELAAEHPTRTTTHERLEGGSSYSLDGEPNSIFAHALAPTPLPGAYSPADGEPSKILPSMAGIKLTREEGAWFNTIWRHEDRGATWAAAIAEAGTFPSPPNVQIMPEVIQGTDEWHDQRRGLVTASVIGKLITPKTFKPASNPESRGLTALLAAERITGWTDPTFVSDDMLRGIEDEPRARAIYAEHYAPVEEVGFMVRDDWGFKIGYSPDGLVGDDGLIEIKSRRQKKHLDTIVSGNPPIENMAQMQCGLLVSGRDWCDYVSFCAGMPLWVARVRPDQRWFDAIVEAARRFEENAAGMIAEYRDRVAGLPATERVVEQEIVI